jgi:hypothetical protein
MDWSAPKKKDPRAGERVRLGMSVAYSLDPPLHADQTPPRSYRQGVLLDISERGFSFKATDSFFIQRIIALRMKLTDQTAAIKMLGKVVWTLPQPDGSTHVGVQFIGALPSDWRELIAATPDPADKR